MDYQNTTLQEVLDRWQEVYAEYKEKESTFEKARQAFMKDCDLRDRKVEEQKTVLLQKNQEIDRQLERLGAHYTANLLEGKDKAAEIIKQKMTEFSSKKIANEILVKSIGKPEYSRPLLEEAERAFEEFGNAHTALSSARSEIMDLTDEMVKALERLYETVKYTGDSMAGLYADRMYKRFRHLPEESDRVATVPTMSYRQEVRSSGSAR